MACATRVPFRHSASTSDAVPSSDGNCVTHATCSVSARSATTVATPAVVAFVTNISPVVEDTTSLSAPTGMVAHKIGEPAKLGPATSPSAALPGCSEHDHAA